MAPRLYTATVFVLYQLSLLLGILLLPVAMVARKAGVELPVHRLIDRLGAAYDRAA
jgi:hypothetical protein